MGTNVVNILENNSDFLLKAVTSTGVGAAQYKDKLSTSFQATVTGTGAVAATINIEVSNDPTQTAWVVLGTITLSGTTTATDGFVSNTPWIYFRGNVTTISGTGATVNLWVGS